MAELEHLIQEFGREGILDSQGYFTVQSQAALRKLRDSSLGNPHNYTLALFRAIVLSGAHKVSVTWDLDDFRLDFDGPGLPLIERLSLTPEGDQLLSYLQIGLLGALSLEPQFVRLRGPDGGLEFRTTEKSTALPKHIGANQIHLRRRIGKTLLWSLGRRIFKEERELQILRETCSTTAIALDFKGKAIKKPLEAQHAWEVKTGTPELLLADSAQTLKSYPAAPIPVHAVFWPARKNATLKLFLCGAEAPSKTLPWNGVHAAISVRDLHLDLSQAQVVEDATFDQLLNWINECRILLLKANPPGWNEAVVAELLDPDSLFAAELADLPVLQERSLNQLRQSACRLGDFEPELEFKLADLGVPFVNPDLRIMFEEYPNTRGEYLATTWGQEKLQWAVPAVGSSLDGMNRLRIYGSRFPECLKLAKSSWPHYGEELSKLATDLLEELAATKTGSDPALTQLACLELGLLCKDPLGTLSTTRLSAELEPPDSPPLLDLFKHLANTGELRLRTTPGPGFVVSEEIAKRIFHGLPGHVVYWNDLVNSNPLATGHFHLVPALPHSVVKINAFFSSAKEIEGGLSVTTYPEGELVLYPQQKRIRVRRESFELEFDSSRVTALRTFHTSTEGDDKTHYYYTLCFSDGLRNYIFEERGKSYHASCYSSSDTNDDASSGFNRVSTMLEGMA